MTTKQEALQYDSDALHVDYDKRRSNIKIFEDTIRKEQAAIKQNRYIISQIDPRHPDVTKLRENIAKMKRNINTFEEAIQQEKDAIEKDHQMIAIIKKVKH